MAKEVRSLLFAPSVMSVASGAEKGDEDEVKPGAVHRSHSIYPPAYRNSR